MAALHYGPDDDEMSIEEALVYLEVTGQPVTKGQLSGKLTRRGATRTWFRGAYYYKMSDVLVAHRDIIDRVRQN